MSFRFSDSFGMFDVTPVENLFMEEYMPRAPGDFVKVYLYGLRLCYHPGAQGDMNAFARALGMEPDVVRDAFSYWEKQGIVRRVADKPPIYQYNNLKAMLVKGASPEDEQLYKLREFNNALQGIFGSRLLSPAEYSRAAEWVDDLGLSEDAVLMMARLSVSNRGGKVSFAYLDKVASSWAKDGLSTKEAAEEYLRTRGGAYAGAQNVIKAMGLKRAPTVAEERLYLKWTDDLGFSHAAIEQALSEMTRIATPNFAYLDKVLENAHKRGATDAEAMERERKTRDEQTMPLREVLEALGLSGGATDDLRGLYQSFLSRGFDHAAVLTAAKHAKRRGGRSMQDVSDALDRFAKRDLFSGEEIERYIAELARERDAAHTLKALAGDESAIERADIAGYRRMIATGLSARMLSLAAEYAKGAREPLSMAAKIAENWRDAGITTPQEAVKEHQARGAGEKGVPSAPSKRKQVSGQQFGQREYTEGEWSALAMDMDALDGGER